MNGNRAPDYPSEAALCSALGLGRSSLREALTSLSFMGLIRARAGEGSFVAEQPSAYLTRPWLNRGLLTTEKELNEFAEARLVLETETAALCASRITEAELNDMERIVAQMKNSLDDVEKFRVSRPGLPSGDWSSRQERCPQ